MEQAVLRVSAILLVVVAMAATAAYLLEGDDSDGPGSSETGRLFDDPLLQDEGHDHRNASEHQFYTQNIEYVGFNPNFDNAEIQVAEAPDGRTYAYQAGWNKMRIIDVTDPYNMSEVGSYSDPNTQVLDVKYIEFDAREYVIIQNQIIDPGNADPDFTTWNDFVQVAVTLVDVTNKAEPIWVDHWN
ncbi:MAG: hypothetical protein QF372_04455, partial [Candidatus Poseidoniia archaeon]|nr:hypothetical protein [Candidatus Poseidoniia archaeon]